MDHPATSTMRRRIVLSLGAVLALAQRAFAQDVVRPEPGVDARLTNTPAGAIRAILRGAAMRRGRVKLELPARADNGHSVPMTVRVDSPMTEADHVREIHLVSEKNPVPHMASFVLGPFMGKAELSSRIRLNGSQRMTAIAQLSDGSFWFDTADVEVVEAACLDGT